MAVTVFCLVVFWSETNLFPPNIVLLLKSPFRSKPKCRETTKVWSDRFGYALDLGKLPNLFRILLLERLALPNTGGQNS